MVKQKEKKYYFYDPYKETQNLEGNPLIMVAVSEKKLPEQVVGSCASHLPRLSLRMKKGTWVRLAIGDPRVLARKVEYLGYKRSLFPIFIQDYYLARPGSTWLVFRYSDGKFLYVNWHFVTDAKNLKK
ncbi:MAG: hypothetical protein PHT40_03465 [Patescibacteria group bacterium]|nr:hypothetical protein [Patescibacteria group bacterium]